MFTPVGKCKMFACGFCKTCNKVAFGQSLEFGIRGAYNVLMEKKKKIVLHSR